MKIAIPLQAMHNLASPPITEQSSNGRSGAGSFDTLLEELLFTSDEDETAIRPAASFAPQIGARSHRFDSAQLLVSTAINLAGPIGSQQDGDRISDLKTEIAQVLQTQFTGHDASDHRSSNGERNTVAVPLRTQGEYRADQRSAMPGEERASFPAVERSPGRDPASQHPNSDQSVGSTAERTRAANAAWPQSTSVSMPEDALLPQKTLQSPLQQHPVAPATQASQSAPMSTEEQSVATVQDPTAPAEGMNARLAPFKVQLQAMEGGLRLVLRLPRLSDNERGEIVEQLEQLFDRHGIRKREILIQDMASE